ncbi:uncharacterized protein LOC113775177 isoform X3 [Coffea eugenioides]|uniref:uncharacterized protein LOC113775177 isoform X3 n=2 Tax=Coffea eugenioides TaxID=49369 RepID=UPI000F60A078|nr:uncharacterized protein LOC113775177 isoform X3 [Coffea eugenioides]
MVSLALDSTILPRTSCRRRILSRSFSSSISTRTSGISPPVIGFKSISIRAFPYKPLIAAAAAASDNNQEAEVEEEQASRRIVLDSLRVLEWDKLCDSVASFAGTCLGKQATKEQLWSLNKTYEDSVRLLQETNAVVEMHKYGAMLDFVGIDTALVKSAIQCAKRDSPVTGSEAMALVALLQFAEALQFNLKAAVKQDADWYQRFMPLSEKISELVISRPLIRFIQQLVDEDGSVKDSASSALKQSREQVRFIERKLYQLMESFIRNEMKETSSLVVSSVDGRWCITSGTKIQSYVKGLLLSSGSGAGSILEPLSAVPLNDQLQQARASVAKAEADVLLKITKKMQMDLNEIEIVFDDMIELDVINARARYSLSFGGSFPDIFLPQAEDGCRPSAVLSKATTSVVSHPTQKNWTLYLPKAYHPLLIQQHRQRLMKAKKDVNDAVAEIRRRKQGGSMVGKKETDLCISSLEQEVAELQEAGPVPSDVFIARNTRVVVITGPNTGGKTICLKTVALAAMMAKSGIYVLASEPVKIPWFDFVFADIGDEQSLSQSLSTFSGHVKQISEILSHSTTLSLVLLDEVGAGTNPQEGAALGMALLESFAEAGPLLTMATTHHGELKTLKYSNKAFENACMEFDEMNLKPTFRILWGVPGSLFNLVAVQMQSALLKGLEFQMQFWIMLVNFMEWLVQKLTRLSKKLHSDLVLTSKNVKEHQRNQRYKMTQKISETAGSARSRLHEKVRQLRTSHNNWQHRSMVKKSEDTLTSVDLQSEAGRSETSNASETLTANNTRQQPVPADKRAEIPKEGDTVVVPSLNKKAVVLKVEPSKEEIVVQAGNMKLKLRLVDVI